MALVHLAENLKEELTCPMCMDYFSRPVTLGCGHSFCRLCLLKSWGETDQPCPCPECKRTFHLRDFELNHSLESLASLARHVKPYLLKIKEENTKCNKHEAEENLFCEEDQALLCEFCFQTPKHSCHTVRPIEKAAEDSRDKLQKTLDLCWKKMERVGNMLTKEREKENSWKKNSQAQRESLAEEYRRFHDLLQEEEQHNSDMLAKQESDHLKSIRESEGRLSQHLQSLREVIMDIEHNCQKPNVQLLQVIGDTMTRCESLLAHLPETVTTPGIAFSHTLMWETLKYFTVDVTLDPKSASSYLIVSDDLKTVEHGGYQQTVTGQFEDSIILGAQVFTFGIHYWEVDVGDSRQWAVGACKDSLSRGGNPSAEDVFLLSNIKNGDLYSIMTIPSYFKYEVHVPIHRVGILLDCDERTISFYDALKKCFIYHFPPFPFPGPLRPFFSPCPPTGEESGTPMTIRNL